MSDVILSLSDEPPSVPRADFGFEIDFRRDAGPASRVFAATHQFIKACEALDSELVQLIDSSIQTVLVLEDIESGSIKTWLRSVLTSADDDALEKLDWKPLVGAYLVRAKYAVIRWVDKDQSLDELRGEIQRIAAETDVRRLPAYAPPSVPALIKAAKDFQAVKDRLVDGDRAKLLTGDGELEMNLSVRMSLDNILLSHREFDQAGASGDDPCRQQARLSRRQRLGAAAWRPNDRRKDPGRKLACAFSEAGDRCSTRRRLALSRGGSSLLWFRQRADRRELLRPRGARRPAIRPRRDGTASRGAQAVVSASLTR